MKITLTKPIHAHDQEITELELREPNIADARAVKSLPYFIGADEEVSLKTDVCARIIVRCAAIPPSSVDQLDLSDYNTLCWWIVGFFLNSRPETTTS
ncbi:phage tail assembly protein [Collimonas sp. H4R21]|jgi:hypothetical protein|uniref:Phage tail assembly protein n=1 Tax=Collimonas rhizosphaerae TaxID=3126357 RepID=A0ABU9PXW0_9BURK